MKNKIIPLSEKMKKAIHSNSCGEPIWNKEHTKIQITCGEDLGGINNEFAQCLACRNEDYIDYLLGENWNTTKNFKQALKDFHESIKEYVRNVEDSHIPLWAIKPLLKKFFGTLAEDGDEK